MISNPPGRILLNLNSTLNRRYVYFILISAAAVSCIAWFTGSDAFDFIDGSEFALCGRNLELPHPPGYPMFIFFLRLFSLPCANLDYGCFRIASAVFAGAGVIAAYAALRSFRCGRAGAIAGSLLLFTLGPVLGQLNIVEVHGFGILLILTSLALRNSRSGPYFFSLSLFAGHPLSALFLPSVLTGRFRQKWVLFALIPLSLWMFIPIRSTFQAVCHYSHPANISLLWNYLTLYDSRLTLPVLNGLEALYRSTGAVSLAVLGILVLYSRKWSWGLFLTATAGLLFLSTYAIPDTASLLWILLLPLAIWAAIGLNRMISGGKYERAAAWILLAVSMLSGISHASRRNDTAASVIARDFIRGAGSEAVFVSVGMTTFHTAYLLEVEDRRPDILPMDVYMCFFRIPPPAELPHSISGRRVYATRGWDQDDLSLSGLLFSAGDVTVNWSIYDIFRYEGDVHDIFASDEIAELWARRAIQSADESERLICEEEALNHVENRIAEERIRKILETN